MPKSVFLGNGNFAYVYTPEQVAELKEIAGLDDRIVTGEDFAERDLADAEYIFSTWGMLKFTDAMFAGMPKLRAVFYAAGATDGFARPFLERGIRISSAWKANAIPVAEFATAQILLALKDYFRLIRATVSPAAWRERPTAPGIFGETVALIGSGTISTLVGEMLRRHRINVITVESFPERRTLSIEEAFRTAYVVSNHLFNTESSHGCIRKEHFLSMRPHATFINTGRGQQVDQEGFLEAMKARPDLTALLDVTYPEPPEADSELFRLPNVLMTPHIAGSINDEVHRMAEYVIDDFKRFLRGEPLRYEVTPEMLAR